MKSRIYPFTGTLVTHGSMKGCGWHGTREIQFEADGSVTAPKRRGTGGARVKKRGTWYVLIQQRRYDVAWLVRRPALDDIMRIEALRWRLLEARRKLIEQQAPVLERIHDHGRMWATNSYGHHAEHRLWILSGDSWRSDDWNALDAVSRLAMIVTDVDREMGRLWDWHDLLIASMGRRIQMVESVLAMSMTLRASTEWGRVSMPQQQRLTVNGRTYYNLPQSSYRGESETRAWPFPDDEIIKP